MQKTPAETRAMKYKKTEKIWNEANKAKRQEMLVDAGHGKNSMFYARAFAFIPQWIRDDIIYCVFRKQKAETPYIPLPTHAAAKPLAYKD